MQRLLRATASRAATIGLTAALVASGTAIAITGGSGNTISACVNKRSGALFVKSKCGKGFRSISWNKVGPTGAAGATGATGPAGPAGPQGAAATISTLTWNTMTLQNGWASTNSLYSTSPPSYAIDQFGIVHLRGGIASGTGELVTQLPAGYRPAYNIYEVDYGYQGNRSEAIDIDTTGKVFVWDVGNPGAITNAASYTGLDGITFPTSN